jgi:hypothetical protein
LVRRSILIVTQTTNGKLPDAGALEELNFGRGQIFETCTSEKFEAGHGAFLLHRHLLFNSSAVRNLPALSFT